MFIIYNWVAGLAWAILSFASVFSRKLQLFVAGRRGVLKLLSQNFTPQDRVIWFHAASLGEFEQGLPVIEGIRLQYPECKILLTFFSPSGYEVRKNNTVADLTVYLPLDTAKNAKKFVGSLNLEMAFFIKYEFWPNYLRELAHKKVPVYLVSGIFRPNQIFFKPYGGFYRNILSVFTHFFVQNGSSKELLSKLGYHNVTVSGDTRFDRVTAILERDNSLPFVSRFKGNNLLVVIGSSWPQDEKLMASYINKSNTATKFLFAPHNIKPEQIEVLSKALTRPFVLFSQMQDDKLEQASVLIVDTVGLLTRIYHYADVAYVGGGFGRPGVHNLLEPATFGIPIICGPNYSHFAEASALVELGGCLSVNNEAELTSTLDLLLQNPDERGEKGHICATFVQMNKNATTRILKHIALGNDQTFEP
jgi:3-deoxy-D-manno-octulosonic-acid transferase